MASNDDDMRNEVPKQIQKSKRLYTFRERQRTRENERGAERREKARARERKSERAPEREKVRERGYWAVGRSLTDMPSACEGQGLSDKTL